MNGQSKSTAESRKNSKAGIYLALHLLMMVFSLSSVCSKMASKQPVMSSKWILFYGLVIVILGIYAIAWQQIIKRMPISTAYANKAASVVWGQVWGLIIFHEGITPGKLIGVIIIICGIVLHAGASTEADAGTGGGSGDRRTTKEAGI